MGFHDTLCLDFKSGRLALLLWLRLNPSVDTDRLLSTEVLQLHQASLARSASSLPDFPSWLTLSPTYSHPHGCPP